MSDTWKEFKGFISGHREWMLLPVLIMLLFLTIVIILNRNTIHTPFVYSNF